MNPIDKFEPNPYWRSSHAPSMGEVLKDIPLLFKKFKTFIRNPKNYDLVEMHVVEWRKKYEGECSRRGDEESLGILQKKQNVEDALEYVFGSELLVQHLEHEFSPSLAQNINRIIGNNGVFGGAGQYRERNAKPSGYNYHYLPPEEIEAAMADLFREINCDVVSGSLSWYAIASKFLERFLKIHPFCNGNGRTARILVSALLCKHTLVPVSLFYRISDGNNVYLKCIDEAHVHGNFELLNSLMIDCTFNSLDYFLSELDGHNSQ